MAEGLYDHLTHPFRSSHDICRIDCLICRDQNKLLNSVPICRKCSLICSKYIVFNRLVRTVFHQRYMLMRSCMIDNIRSVFCKNTVDFSTVSHRTNQNNQIQIRVFMLQFLLDIVCIIFIDIKNDQSLYSICCNLTAQLTSDASASSSDKDNFIIHISFYGLCLDIDRFSAKQVFNLHIAKLLNADIPIHKLIYPRKNLQICIGILTNSKDRLDLFLFGTWHCQNNLINLIFFYIFQNFISATHYFYTVDISSGFSRIVIDDTANLCIELFTHFKFLHHNIARLSRTDDHRAPHVLTMNTASIDHSDKSIGKSANTSA